MPRPLRIQYDNAFYHVMNRGRGRRTIFHGEDYYGAFLKTLKESASRFGLEVHAYCLLGNHYHLFVRTPRANLDRCMRHVNGVYTQRYNRLKRTDGPLFRGRYKAILVDADTYGLRLSRYIHRNPIEMNKPMVDLLEDYQWSSYRCYLNKTKSPEWLCRDFTYGLLGAKKKYQSYKNFVEEGTDEELANFYSKNKVKAILGSDEFIEEIADSESVDEGRLNKEQGRLPTIGIIVDKVANEFGVIPESIYRSRRGRGMANIPRWMALYLCREVGGHSLSEIASAFHINHISGIHHGISRLHIKVRTEKDLGKVKKLLIQYLTP